MSVSPVEELYFPIHWKQCQEISCTKNIPSLVVTESKYSSTDTEISSDEYDSNNIVHFTEKGRFSISGFSTSPASSTGSSQKRRNRRRRKMTNGQATLSIMANKSVKSSVSGTMYHQNLQNGLTNESMQASVILEKKARNLPALNSINDLKHATGRRRGISGGFMPSVDASLFAMFYVTDVFDELLTDSINDRLLPHSTYTNRSSLRKDIISILRKEIVYSIRINYFCPSSKVDRLVRLVEQHYPLDQLQDPAKFLDILFGEVLKQPPFFIHSNGSTGFLHSIHLENYFTKQFYFQPVALTIQQLLLRGNLLSRISSRKYQLKGSAIPNFSTVPYPVLMLKVIRNASMHYWNNDDESTYHWKYSSEKNYRQPVIPNLKIDITDLMSKNNGDSRFLHHSYKSSMNEIGNKKFFDSASFGPCYESEKFFSCHSDGVGQPTESRIVQGLKSAWKAVYKCLEDLSVSPSYFSSHECLSQSIDTIVTSSDVADKSGGNHHDFYEDKMSTSLETVSHLSSSPSPSLLSLTSSRHSLSDFHNKTDLESNFTASQKIQVKMELIAVICKSRATIEIAERYEKVYGENEGVCLYTVYCKAGRSSAMINADHPENIPWVQYQSRKGIVPQVVLIENFEKWLNSLENHHESLNLNQVPMDIRRVLEDSYIFIYQRIEK